MVHKLSEKWIKASIAGTIWAASEIVLGSFLHNLRIPFSGNILTAIGLIILISVSYMWTEKGLFWRAGLICALMKTMSPSAVIFGPMIAIFTESLLLELSTRLLGRTMAGFAVGSMLAMSWNLFQKILNYIIYYGANIIAIYTDLLKYTQKQLSIKSDITWLPVIILLVLYALFGLLAAIIGIRTGRRMMSGQFKAESLQAGRTLPGQKGRSAEDFDYSVTWLAMNICMIILSFVLLSKTEWKIWAPAVTVAVVVWSFRYKRALRQLMKPGFWIFFVLITLLTSFLFSVGQKGEHALLNGLITGIQMNFRAVLMIVGFSVLGTELYNPVVRSFFMRTSFRNLPLALELASESLPYFIACIPDSRAILKNPVSVFHRVLSHADARLAGIAASSSVQRNVYIITGTIRGGKTTFTGELVKRLRVAGIDTGGILSVRVTEGQETRGYDITDIESGSTTRFLRLGCDQPAGKIGRFEICSEGLGAGKTILRSAKERKKRLVVIDEAGMLELDGGGWAESITELLAEPGTDLLISVRDIFVDELIRKFDLQGAVIFDISSITTDDVLSFIKQRTSAGT